MPKGVKEEFDPFILTSDKKRDLQTELIAFREKLTEAAASEEQAQTETGFLIAKINQAADVSRAIIEGLFTIEQYFDIILYILNQQNVDLEQLFRVFDLLSNHHYQPLTSKFKVLVTDKIGVVTAASPSVAVSPSMPATPLQSRGPSTSQTPVMPSPTASSITGASPSISILDVGEGGTDDLSERSGSRRVSAASADLVAVSPAIVRTPIRHQTQPQSTTPPASVPSVVFTKVPINVTTRATQIAQRMSALITRFDLDNESAKVGHGAEHDLRINFSRKLLFDCPEIMLHLIPELKYTALISCALTPVLSMRMCLVQLESYSDLDRENKAWLNVEVMPVLLGFKRKIWAPDVYKAFNSSHIKSLITFLQFCQDEAIVGSVCEKIFINCKGSSQPESEDRCFLLQQYSQYQKIDEIISRFHIIVLRLSLEGDQLLMTIATILERITKREATGLAAESDVLGEPHQKQRFLEGFFAHENIKRKLPDAIRGAFQDGDRLSNLMRDLTIILNNESVVEALLPGNTSGVVAKVKDDDKKEVSATLNPLWTSSNYHQNLPLLLPFLRSERFYEACNFNGDHIDTRLSGFLNFGLVKAAKLLMRIRNQKKGFMKQNVFSDDRVFCIAYFVFYLGYSHSAQVNKTHSFYPLQDAGLVEEAAVVLCSHPLFSIQVKRILQAEQTYDPVVARNPFLYALKHGTALPAALLECASAMEIEFYELVYGLCQFQMTEKEVADVFARKEKTFNHVCPKTFREINFRFPKHPWELSIYVCSMLQQFHDSPAAIGTAADSSEVVVTSDKYIERWGRYFTASKLQRLQVLKSLANKDFCQSLIREIAGSASATVVSGSGASDPARMSLREGEGSVAESEHGGASAEPSAAVVVAGHPLELFYQVLRRAIGLDFLEREVDSAIICGLMENGLINTVSFLSVGVVNKLLEQSPRSLEALFKTPEALQLMRTFFSGEGVVECFLDKDALQGLIETTQVPGEVEADDTARRRRILAFVELIKSDVVTLEMMQPYQQVFILPECVSKIKPNTMDLDHFEEERINQREQRFSKVVMNAIVSGGVLEDAAVVTINTLIILVQNQLLQEEHFPRLIGRADFYQLFRSLSCGDLLHNEFFIKALCDTQDLLDLIFRAEDTLGKLSPAEVLKIFFMRVTAPNGLSRFVVPQELTELAQKCPAILARVLFLNEFVSDDLSLNIKIFNATRDHGEGADGSTGSSCLRFNVCEKEDQQSIDVESGNVIVRLTEGRLRDLFVRGDDECRMDPHLVGRYFPRTARERSRATSAGSTDGLTLLDIGERLSSASVVTGVDISGNRLANFFRSLPIRIQTLDFRLILIILSDPRVSYRDVITGRGRLVPVFHELNERARPLDDTEMLALKAVAELRHKLRDGASANPVPDDKKILGLVIEMFFSRLEEDETRFANFIYNNSSLFWELVDTAKTAEVSASCLRSSPELLLKMLDMVDWNEGKIISRLYYLMTIFPINRMAELVTKTTEMSLEKLQRFIITLDNLIRRDPVMKQNMDDTCSSAADTFALENVMRVGARVGISGLSMPEIRVFLAFALAVPEVKCWIEGKYLLDLCKHPALIPGVIENPDVLLKLLCEPDIQFFDKLEFLTSFRVLQRLREPKQPLVEVMQKLLAHNRRVPAVPDGGVEEINHGAAGEQDAVEAPDLFTRLVPIPEHANAIITKIFCSPTLLHALLINGHSFGEQEVAIIQGLCERDFENSGLGKIITAAIEHYASAAKVAPASARSGDDFERDALAARDLALSQRDMAQASEVLQAIIRQPGLLKIVSRQAGVIDCVLDEIIDGINAEDIDRFVWENPELSAKIGQRLVVRCQAIQIEDGAMERFSHEADWFCAAPHLFAQAAARTELFMNLAGINSQVFMVLVDNFRLDGVLRFQVDGGLVNAAFSLHDLWACIRDTSSDGEFYQSFIIELIKRGRVEAVLNAMDSASLESKMKYWHYLFTMQLVRADESEVKQIKDSLTVVITANERLSSVFQKQYVDYLKAKPKRFMELVESNPTCFQVLVSQMACSDATAMADVVGAGCDGPVLASTKKNPVFSQADFLYFFSHGSYSALLSLAAQVETIGLYEYKFTFFELLNIARNNPDFFRALIDSEKLRNCLHFNSMHFYLFILNDVAFDCEWYLAPEGQKQQPVPQFLYDALVNVNLLTFSSDLHDILRKLLERIASLRETRPARDLPKMADFCQLLTSSESSETITEQTIKTYSLRDMLNSENLRYLRNRIDVNADFRTPQCARRLLQYTQYAFAEMTHEHKDYILMCRWLCFLFTQGESKISWTAIREQTSTLLHSVLMVPEMHLYLFCNFGLDQAFGLISSDSEQFKNIITQTFMRCSASDIRDDEMRHIFEAVKELRGLSRNFFELLSNELKKLLKADKSARLLYIENQEIARGSRRPAATPNHDSRGGSGVTSPERRVSVHHATLHRTPPSSSSGGRGSSRDDAPFRSMPVGRGGGGPDRAS